MVTVDTFDKLNKFTFWQVHYYTQTHELQLSDYFCLLLGSNWQILGQYQVTVCTHICVIMYKIRSLKIECFFKKLSTLFNTKVFFLISENRRFLSLAIKDDFFPPCLNQLSWSLYLCLCKSKTAQSSVEVDSLCNY